MSEPKHTAELAYRPNGDRDDWGFIRDPEGNLKLIVRGYTPDRVETTDPYEEFGREVVRRYNAFPDLLEACTRALTHLGCDPCGLTEAIAKAQPEGGK